MDELLCLMFAGCDGRTANAEHQWKRRRHIYVVYGPPSWPVRLVCHLPCRPCSGPRQLKFGDYYLLVEILGVFGVSRSYLLQYPIF